MKGKQIGYLKGWGYKCEYRNKSKIKKALLVEAISMIFGFRHAMGYSFSFQ